MTWRDSCATRGLLKLRLTSRGSGAGVPAPALSFPRIAGLLSPRLSCLRIVTEIVLGTQIDLSLAHLPRSGGDVSPQPAQFLGPWPNMDHLLGGSFVDRIDFCLKRMLRGAWQGLPELPVEGLHWGRGLRSQLRGPQEARYRKARAAGRLTQHSPDFPRMALRPSCSCYSNTRPSRRTAVCKLTGETLGGYEATLALALQGHIPGRLGATCPGISARRQR